MITWIILSNHVYFHAVALELQLYLINPHVKRIGKWAIAITIVFDRFWCRKNDVIIVQVYELVLESCSVIAYFDHGEINKSRQLVTTATGTRPRK